MDADKTAALWSRYRSRKIDETIHPDDDRYVCDNGVWLCEVMNLHVNLFAPHQGSWADTAVQ